MLPHSLLSQKFTMTVNQVSAPANVSAIDFRNIALRLIVTDTGGSSALAVRVRGSFQKAPPDFTIPSSDSNQWAFIQTKNISNNTYYDGDAGIPIVAAGSYAIELNEDQLSWVAMEVFSRTNGQVIGQFIFKDNQ